MATVARISFCGDLILLKDQVSDGYVPSRGTYAFDVPLSGLGDLLTRSDLAIGVCEGPMAGSKVGYSDTNLRDGKEPFSLNFPDEFATAMANAGIDLVTISNNHILDKGIEGALRTREVLTSAGIQSVGFFANDREYDQMQIVERKGLKIAVLAYTYGCNYRESDELLDERHVKVLLPRQHARLVDSEKVVLRDLRRARESGADFVVVLPHLGTEFVHFPDSQQRFWCKFFVRHGADLVLCAHSHNTQPVVWYGNSVVVYSPGNLINSYTHKDVDAGMIVDIFVSVQRKRIERVSIVPTICRRGDRGYFVQPVHSLKGQPNVRADEVSRIVTYSVLGRAVPLSKSQNDYDVQRRNLWRMHDLCREAVNMGRRIGRKLMRFILK